eukprot:1046964-Pyramimonas_sp.AAC.1
MSWGRGGRIEEVEEDEEESQGGGEEGRGGERGGEGCAIGRGSVSPNRKIPQWAECFTEGFASDGEADELDGSGSDDPNDAGEVPDDEQAEPEDEDVPAEDPEEAPEAAQEKPPASAAARGSRGRPGVSVLEPLVQTAAWDLGYDGRMQAWPTTPMTIEATPPTID